VIPEVHYARTPEGVHIAYVVIGEGPMDVVFAGWGYSNIEYTWRIPNQRGFLQKIGSIGRLIYFDPRGMGLSDKIGGGQLPTLESQMGDVLSVMDAVGSNRAALLGFDASGPLAILFAATHPERTAALVVYGSEPANDSAPTTPADGPTSNGTHTWRSWNVAGDNLTTSRSSTNGWRHHRSPSTGKHWRRKRPPSV
jgi:pimeloyl-ACP methyl ester carboxylesterase